MTTAVKQIKKLLGLHSFEGYLGLVKPIEKLVAERDKAKADLQEASVTIKAEILEQLSKNFSPILNEGGKLETLNAAYSLAHGCALTAKSAAETKEYDDGMRLAMQQISRACGKKFAVDIGYEQLPVLVEELLGCPDTTQPQLSEIRYVLHGDIQPCTVLYSDDTTTLLRLDEGDVMCETDTIEWSDSVTYRCQELLRSTGLNKINLTRVSGHLAQLVREERILLNDNGGEESVDTVEVHTLGEKEPRQVPTEPVPCREITYKQYVEECFSHDAAPMSAQEWLSAGRPHFNP